MAGAQNDFTRDVFEKIFDALKTEGLCLINSKNDGIDKVRSTATPRFWRKREWNVDGFFYLIRNTLRRYYTVEIHPIDRNKLIIQNGRREHELGMQLFSGEYKSAL